LENKESSARLAAISYIGISQKSSGRVVEYLIHKEYSAEVAHSVVDLLVADGYINDMRVANSICRGKVLRQSEGKALLRQRMLHKGISRDAIELTLVTLPSDEESIIDLIEARLIPEYQSMLTTTDFDISLWTKKTIRFLINRGYSVSIAVDALRKSLHEVE